METRGEGERAFPKEVLITGGAGFIGSNLADYLIGRGYRVRVLDDLSRRGVQRNLEWLRERHKDKLTFLKLDIRDFEKLREAMEGVELVYHLAGQTAVTMSVADPRQDFEVNALGTFNVLEAARAQVPLPIVVFTSTNKVYGGMEDLAIVKGDTRYEYRDYPQGIGEDRGLDFHSPYGCSKGAADQYVRDYARIYGLPTVVFRMSCIYGPRQFGTEDQGWVAHFVIATVLGRPLTIYGDGRQVRDILYVEDLLRAFRLAVEEIQTTRGQVYNIGGGPANTISVWSEFKELLARLLGRPVVAAGFADWRPGDQLVYVSDISKARRDFGWEPKVDKLRGIERLYRWVVENKSLFT